MSANKQIGWSQESILLHGVSKQLDRLATLVASSGGGGGGATNLSYTASPTNGLVNSSTGFPAVVPLANSTNAGLLSPADFTKLLTVPNDANLLHKTGNEIKTGTLTVNSIITAGGTSSQFVKGDGTLDSNIYGIDNTLIHTTGDEIKTGNLTVNSIIKAGGIAAQYLMADGSTTTIVGILSEVLTPNIVNGDVTHAPNGNAIFNALLLKADNANVIHTTGDEIKTGNLTVNAIIKSGGLSTEFLKADGTVDTTLYAPDSTVIHNTGNETKTGTFTATSLIKSGGLVTEYLMANGTVSTLANIASGIITPTITNGDTTHAPSGDAVFDALALKADNANVIHTTGNETKTGNLTVNSIIRAGGLSTQFLKADGSIDSTLYVTPTRTISINGVLQNLSTDREWRTAQADTGILSFATPGITVASGTQINIGAVTGWVIDNETNPAIPTSVFVNYPGASNVTVPTIGSGLVTYILLLPNGSGGGTLVFQNTLPTSAQRKTHLWLGKAAHPLGVITVAGNEPDIITSPLAQYRDMFQALGPYINSGVLPYPNGANLTINVTAGQVLGNGINFVTDRTNPDQISVSGTPISFLPRTQTGNGGVAITNVDVQNYDVAGTVTLIPGSGARATVRYIYYIPNLGFLIQYGQQFYNNLSDAIAAIGKESQVIYPPLANNSILIGVLAARKDATLLNNPAQAQFFPADKLGQIIGATAGVSVGTRQTSYNNSLQPQTVVSDALGADIWRSGRALNTSTVMEWQNIAGTTTASVNGNGTITALSFVKTGGLISQYLMADGSVSTLTNPITGTGTTNFVSKWLTSSTQGSSQIFDNGTNVGIGTSTPTTAKLVVETSGISTIAISAKNTTTTSQSVINVINNDNTAGIELGINNTAYVSTPPYGSANDVFIRSSLNTKDLNIVNTSNTDGNIRFLNSLAAGAATERMRIIANGNVGIGTATPISQLHVSHIGNASLTGALTVGDRDTPASTTGIYLRSNTASTITWSAGYLAFLNGATERMRMIDTGNIGIGITNPATNRLYVQNDVSTVMAVRNSTAVGQTILQQVNNDATVMLLSGVNNTTFVIDPIYGKAGDSFIRSNNGGRDLNIINSSTTDGVIRFLTGNAGTPLERMRIAYDGNVGIGTTAPNAKLHTVVSDSTQYSDTAVLTNQLAVSNVHNAGTTLTQSVLALVASSNNASNNAIATISAIQPTNANNAANLTFKVRTTAGPMLEAIRILDNGNVGIGVTAPTANLHIAASTTTKALMRLTVGAAPTTPNDGDVWLESNTNTGLKIRIAGVTKTISLV